MPKLRDQPCERCGWIYPGFHVCIDMSDPTVSDVVLTDKERKPRASRANPLSDRGQKLREHYARDPRRIERNKQIVELYNDHEMTMREIGAKLSVDPTTVRNVLHQAADKGDVIIRKAARRTGGY
jgi:DNA-binding CsgD family transcriptional regulator